MALSLDPRDAAWLNDRVLGELGILLVRQLEQQVVAAQVGGRELRGRLESARLERGALRQGARVELVDVEWDGWVIERLGARARAVRMSRLPPPRLIASDVEIVGATAIESLVGWLDGRVPRWNLAVAHDGKLLARRGRRGPAAGAQVFGDDHELDLGG